MIWTQELVVHALPLIELFEQEEALHLLVHLFEPQHVSLHERLQLHLIRIPIVDHVLQHEHLVVIDLGDGHLVEVLDHKTEVFPDIAQTAFQSYRCLLETVQ